MSSSHEINWHSHYHILNIVMPLGLSYLVLLLLLQLCAVRWYNLKFGKKALECNSLYSICILGVYLLQILCGVGCIIAHTSRAFDELYCVIAAPICTILYGAARCFLYGVWLERAKMVNQGYVAFIPQIVLDKFLPAYIGFYYTLQAIMIGIFFRGKFVPNSEDGVVTSCNFDEWAEWVPILATVADGFNTFFFLGLFIYPIYQNLKYFIIEDPEKAKKFTAAMKRNVISTAICSISSMSTIVILADQRYLVPLFVNYLWLITIIDMVINGTCIYFLFAPNRTFLRYLIKRPKELCRPNATVESTQSKQIELHGTISAKSTPNDSRQISSDGDTVDQQHPSQNASITFNLETEYE